MQYTIHRYQLIFYRKFFKLKSRNLSPFSWKKASNDFEAILSRQVALVFAIQNSGVKWFLKKYFYFSYFSSIFLLCVQSTNYAFAMNKSSKHRWMEIWMLLQKNMIPLCNNNSVTNQISAQLLNRTDWLLSAQQAYFFVWFMRSVESPGTVWPKFSEYFWSEQDIRFLSVKLEIPSEPQHLTEFATL